MLPGRRLCLTLDPSISSNSINPHSQIASSSYALKLDNEGMISISQTVKWPSFVFISKIVFFNSFGPLSLNPST